MKDILNDDCWTDFFPSEAQTTPSNKSDVYLKKGPELGSYFGAVGYDGFTLKLRVVQGHAGSEPVCIARGFVRMPQQLLAAHWTGSRWIEGTLLDMVAAYLLDQSSLRLYAHGTSHLAIEATAPTTERTACAAVAKALESVVSFVDDAEPFLRELVTERIDPCDLEEAFLFHLGLKSRYDDRADLFDDATLTATAFKFRRLREAGANEPSPDRDATTSENGEPGSESENKPGSEPENAGVHDAGDEAECKTPESEASHER